MAALYAKGELALDEDFIHEGPLGTLFTGRLMSWIFIYVTVLCVAACFSHAPVERMSWICSMAWSHSSSRV